MSAPATILSKQEKKWISERRVSRLTDNKEVQIYPMGAERYLSSTLGDNKKGRYNIRADITGKDVLLIPGYGNSSFLFAQAGAKSVTVYDKDPVTIAWIKAFKKYYHYREHSGKNGNCYPSIGELLAALTRWYPPLITLPTATFRNRLFWALNPNSLRRVYIHYMLDLIRQALQENVTGNFEFDKKIEFHVGTVDSLLKTHEKAVFDTVFVPYLLGVQNGIEQQQEIVNFMKQLIKLVPKGKILISPSMNAKEFYIVGKRYFITSGYLSILTIPELKPYVLGEDKYWCRTQGLAIFGPQSP